MSSNTATPLYHDADILVVDDNPVNVELLMDLLEDEGYTHVEGLTEPLRVKDRVLAQRPDLILLDIRMPGISGLEILAQLEQELGEAAPAAIVLTAQIDEQARHQALKLGAQDFLTKPFNHIEALQRINNTLQLQRLLSSQAERADLLEEMVKQRTKELALLSRQDPVTALPNRHVILEALDQFKAEQKHVLVFFIALEGTDEINRLHNYQVTDQVLRKVSERLQQAVLCDQCSNLSHARLLGTWSSDKWVAIYAASDIEQCVGSIAEQLLNTIHTPLPIDNLLLYVRARIGVSDTTMPRSAEQVVRMAAIAQPEETGQWQRYSQELENTLTRRIQVRDALHHALKKDELYLLYQPKVNMHTGELCGAEALLRWQNSTLGAVSPMEFIPIAEANGDIIAIGKWVIEHSITTLLRWRKAGLVNADFSLAVNVASSQLMQPDFANWLIHTVEDAGLPTELLEIEVTESGIMQDMRLAKQQLDRLSEAGFKIAIDDFGTGHSSLAYLRTLPISILKIDREFIREMHQNPLDQNLTGTIIAMAKHFDFSTVAEGVEEPVQLNLLRDMGCDVAQGFIFAPPVKEATLLVLVQNGFAATIQENQA